MSNLLAAINHAIVQEHFNVSSLAKLTGTTVRSYTEAADPRQLDSLTSRIYYRGVEFRGAQRGVYRQSEVTISVRQAFESLVFRLKNINTQYFLDFSTHPVHFNVIQEHAYDTHDDVYIFTLFADFLKVTQ